MNDVHLSFGAKGIAGVGRDGFGFGVEGRVRIGDRDATNLILAASTVAQVGYLSRAWGIRSRSATPEPAGPRR